MADYVMSQAATLFFGPDTEKWSIRPDSHFFDRLDNAVRFAFEKLTPDQKNGARIQLEANHQILPWPEIEALFKKL